MTKTRIIQVRCTYVLPVEVPDASDYDAYFDIEENHCPGTGLVGAALEEHMKSHEKRSTCWACALGGTCEIVGNQE